MNKQIDIYRLVRPNILDLKPYRSARDDFDSGILLDANENAIGAPFDEPDELNRYPMPYQEELREKIADFRDVKRENIFVGVGSDEAIDLLYRIFCRPGTDRALITPPTYGMYKVSAGINDVAVDQALLTPDFQLDVDATLAAVTEQTKLLFVCSPNNPTANSLNREDILILADRFDGILVIDEAYIDFSNQESFAKEVRSRNNIVVLQTLSKSFGLAGIRLGIAIASPEIIGLMMKVKAPYNVNKLTSKTAIKAFTYENAMKARVQQILEERDKMIKKLESAEAVEHIYPSDANFVLFRIADAETVYKKLADKGVVVRYRGNEPHCENCLRLTIGTKTENEQFITALKEVTES